VLFVGKLRTFPFLGGYKLWDDVLIDDFFSRCSGVSRAGVNRVMKTHIQVKSKGTVRHCLVSVILPIYNEVECIEQTFDAVLNYAKEHPAYQFIFVNDGSSDRTQELLEKKLGATEAEQIRLISYHDRRGKGHAVKIGVECAEGTYICFIDGDLAYSLDHIDLLIEKLDRSDLVIGSRGLARRQIVGLRLSRRVAGKVFNILSNLILGLHYRDMQAGLKGFRKWVAQDLFRKQRLDGFSFDVELIYLAKKEGYRISEIPAIVSDDHGKKTSQVKLVQDSMQMFFDLLIIRFNDILGHYE
jgi:glycosyltransferase involved in cell wall biosynthesis